MFFYILQQIKFGVYISKTFRFVCGKAAPQSKILQISKGKGRNKAPQAKFLQFTLPFSWPSYTLLIFGKTPPPYLTIPPLKFLLRKLGAEWPPLTEIFENLSTIYDSLLGFLMDALTKNFTLYSSLKWIFSSSVHFLNNQSFCIGKKKNKLRFW